MTLERVGADDAASLSRAHARSFEASWSDADIGSLLASPGGFGLAVREGDEISGLLIGRAIGGESEVLTLAVDPAARRRGLARALVEAALIAARTAGAEAMFLEVAADNHAALALYAGAGFLRVGVRSAYYHRADGRVDALVLRRDLNSRPR